MALDPLAVEDAVGRHERPKVDRYPTHLFVNAYATAIVGDGQLRPAKVSAFVLPQALVTVRQEAWFDIEQVVRNWDDNPDLSEYGPASPLYGLLDVIVDGHFDTLQRMDDRIEDIEDRALRRSAADGCMQRATYDLRKRLVRLRKLILPMRRGRRVAAAQRGSQARRRDDRAAARTCTTTCCAPTSGTTVCAT